MRIKYINLLIFSSLGFLFISSTPQNQPEFISPSSKVNSKMRGKSPDQIEYLRFEYDDNKLTLDPLLEPHWTWFAGKGFEAGGKEIQFFFWNGILFTNHTDLKFTNFRSRKYKKLFTDIEANAFAICFERYDEAVLFTAVDKAQEVEIVIPEKYMGKELKFNFDLKDNEAKFVRISSTNSPFKP